jgi:DNA-directed RNA polymerase subunit RPC12/RpoP
VSGIAAQLTFTKAFDPVRTELVYGSGNQFLAGSGFPVDLAFTSRCKAKEEVALECSFNVDRGYRALKVVSEDDGTRPCENIARGPRRGMIDSLLNLLFRCSHRRLTRPVTPIAKPGHPHSQSYVVCLDCGKQFEYDLSQMSIGKAIDHSHEAGAQPPDRPTPRKTKVG